MSFSYFFCEIYWPKTYWLVEGDPVRSLFGLSLLPVTLLLIFEWGGSWATLIGFISLMGWLLGVFGLVFSRYYIFKKILHRSYFFKGTGSFFRALMMLIGMGLISFVMSGDGRDGGIISMELSIFSFYWWRLLSLVYLSMASLVLLTKVFNRVEVFFDSIGFLEQKR